MTIFANQALVKPNLHGSTLVNYYEPTKEKSSKLTKGEMVPNKPCRSSGVNLFELLILEFNTFEIIVNTQEPTHWEKLQQAYKINFISHLFVIVQASPPLHVATTSTTQQS